MPEASCCCCWHQKVAEPGRSEEVLLSRSYQEHAIAVPAAWCYPTSLEWPASRPENRTSVLTSQTQWLQRGFPLPLPKPQKNFVTEAPAWCFPRLISYYTLQAFPPAPTSLQGLLIGLNCMARQGAAEDRERCCSRELLGGDAFSRAAPVGRAVQPQLKAISYFRKNENPKCGQLAALNLCSPSWAQQGSSSFLKPH